MTLISATHFPSFSATGGFRREVQPRRQHWFLNEKSGFPFRTPAFCSVSRGQRRLAEKEYRAPSVTPGVALRPRTQAVAKSNRLPSARRWSGIERKISNSDAGMRQPPIRVVAYRFRHFRPRESQSSVTDRRTERPWTNTTLGIGVNYTPNISIEWKQYGVGLDFTPTVLNNGIINLQLNPSVTEVNTANSLNINGTTVPSLIERKAHTAVELRDGQSFAVAGLLLAQSSDTINQLPWVGNVPILGALFRSTDFQKNQTDLVIIVSPHLVRPVRPGQHLATPFDTSLQANDIDMFLMGDSERQKRYTDYVTSGGGLQGPYGHILGAE